MSAPPRHLVLGAAGHVDHGKTALIAALTGVNTDRLKEERERGISIELGFAEFPLGDDLVLGVVDMPGHERFVRQMVAGAGGVDLAILVVAADEGVMPQTVEHLEILDSLGTRGGVVVLSKADLVDEEVLAVAAEEVRELVAGTFLEGRPVVAASAVTGRGLDEVRRAVAEQARLVPPRPREGPFRLPLDRVFTLPGIGVVVTGTCLGGQVAVGDRLAIEPAGLKVRVREIQAHGRAVPVGGSGQRLALALHGVKREDLERGWQAVTPGCCAGTRRLDVRVDLLAHYRGTVKHRQRLHVHHAGREVLGRILLLDQRELGGEAGPRTGLAQLHLEAPLVALPGDRLVLRFYSPVTSIAGGLVLDCAPPRRRRFDERTLAALAVLEQGDPGELWRQTLREAGLAGVPAAEAPAGAADEPEAVAVGGRFYDREVLAERAEAIGRLIGEHLAKFPLRLGMPKEEARRRSGFKGGSNEWSALCEHLAGTAGWRVAGDKLVPAAAPPLPPDLAAAVASRRERLRQLGLQWPGLAAFREEQPAPRGRDFREEEYLRHLVETGEAVQIGPDHYVAAAALRELRDALAAHFAAGPELSFGEFRELSGLTRKLGIPLLEYLDQTGVTERVGDARRAGPALAG